MGFGLWIGPLVGRNILLEIVTTGAERTTERTNNQLSAGNGSPPPTPNGRQNLVQAALLQNVFFGLFYCDNAGCIESDYTAARGPSGCSDCRGSLLSRCHITHYPRATRAKRWFGPTSFLSGDGRRSI
jgi:hypothetical protein